MPALLRSDKRWFIGLQASTCDRVASFAMDSPQLEGQVQRALALGWTFTELLGRYNRYLHPDSPESKGSSSTQGQLHRLTYTSHEEMAEHNTYQAYACALRILALIDALGLQPQEPRSAPELETTIKDLPGAIRDYQRRSPKPKQQKDHPALGRQRFWRGLEDSSCLVRAKLYSASADLAFCFSFGGMLAELYWLLPVDDRGHFINPMEEVGKLYFKMGDAQEILDRLEDSLPLSSRISLGHTLSKWRSLTKKWRKRRKAIRLEEHDAARILRALGKQTANWTLIALGEKTPEQYLTQSDRALARAASFLVPAVVGVSVSAIILGGLFLLLRHTFVSTILPHLDELLTGEGLKPQVNLELKAVDVFSITFGFISALATVGPPAYFASRSFLRALNHLRRWLFERAVGSLAGRRMLVLPTLPG